MAYVKFNFKQILFKTIFRFVTLRKTLKFYVLRIQFYIGQENFRMIYAV